jgi:hypothetical protein
MCNNLAYIAQHAGDHEAAVDLARRSLRLARERRSQRDMADALWILAGSISTLATPDTEGPLRAARLLGATEAARQELGALHQPADQPEMDRITAAVRARCGGDTDAFRTAWAEGSRMTLEQAAAYALGEGE